MYQSDRESELPSLWPPIIVAICIGLLICLLTSCGPSRSVPPGTPYPTTLGPQFKGGIYGINQTRCFGGGIGGCSLGGKALGGPVN